MSPISLSGICPPIPTPFKASGDIDFDHLQSNLDRWNKEPLLGYVVGGSNGEYAYCSTEERVEVVRAARQAIPRERLLIAGSGMESTSQAIALTHRMAGAGADLCIVITPGYYKARMTVAAFEHHYREIADHSAIPLLLYSVPANTGVDLPVQAIVSLAAHPTIVGIKDSGGDVTKIGLVAHETRGADFQVVAGSAGFFLAALSVGAVGCIPALGNIAGAKLADMLGSFQRGDLARARSIQLPLIEANTAVTSRFGVPGLKAAMDMLGYYGGPVRSPLLPLSDTDLADLRHILTTAGLL